MRTQGYKQLAQGTDHDLSLATEQEGQSNEYGHGLERTSSSSTDPTNPANGQSDPSTTTNADPITTTNGDSGTMLSFEMDLGEPLVVDTMMNRFRRTLFGKKRTLLVGCAAVLLGIVMVSLTLMAFNRHQPITLSPRETVAHLVQSRLPSISFDSPTSPESKALDWMVNVDEFDYKAVSDDRLVQRFAVAAMVDDLGLEGEQHMLTSESVCNWTLWHLVYGWTCNNDGVVTAILYSDSNEYECFLPASIGLLTGLTTLDFDENDCAGTFSTEIGLLTGLTTLNAGCNELSGSFPTEIGLLTRLTYLHLGSNDLTGTIPTEIGLLTGLGDLYLNRNNLSRSIPTEIGLLTSLTLLYLDGNDFTGTIPTEIGMLTSLYELHLGTNHLTGSIPTEIALLTSLTYLDIADNRLSGAIPTRLCSHHRHSFRIDCDKITCSCCEGMEWNPCPTN